MVELVYDRGDRVAVCTWIGQHIEAVNAQLAAHLQACNDCVHPEEQPTLQIFAAPLASSFQVAALCNFQTSPLTLLIDVGQVVTEDWLWLVVHEYAHAHAGSPGHHTAYGRSLTHLCLGLGIPPPPDPKHEATLRIYPPCRGTADPLAFWRGESTQNRLRQSTKA